MPYVTKEFRKELRQKSNGRILSRKGDVNRPPRSRDLTPWSIYIRAHQKVEKNNPGSIPELNKEIIHANGDIEPQLYQNELNVLKKW